MGSVMATIVAPLVTMVARFGGKHDKQGRRHGAEEEEFGFRTHGRKGWSCVVGF